MDLRQMAREEKHQIASMMAGVFLSDALWMTMIPDELRRYQFLELYSLFQLEWVLKNGLVEVTNSLTGAMLWLLPNKKRNNTQYLDWHMMRAFLSVDSHSRSQVTTYLEFVRQMEKKYQKPGTWQLLSLAVDEHWQHQGIGRVLLRKHMRRLDSQGAFAFTMTHGVLAQQLFHKLGFFTMVHQELFLPDNQLYILERAPRVSTDIRI